MFFDFIITGDSETKVLSSSLKNSSDVEARLKETQQQIEKYKGNGVMYSFFVWCYVFARDIFHEFIFLTY